VLDGKKKPPPIDEGESVQIYKFKPSP